MWHTYRNQVTATIRKSQSTYYSDQTNEASNNSTLMWKIFECVLPFNKHYSSSSEIDPEIFNTVSLLLYKRSGSNREPSNYKPIFVVITVAEKFDKAQIVSYFAANYLKPPF